MLRPASPANAGTSAPPLEVESEPETDDSRIEQLGHLLESGTGGVPKFRHGPGVGQVEDIDHSGHASEPAEPDGLIEAEVEDLHCLAAIGCDWLDAHGTSAISGEGHTERAAPVAAALHLPGSGEPDVERHGVAADDLVVPQRGGFVAVVAKEQVGRPIAERLSLAG